MHDTPLGCPGGWGWRAGASDRAQQCARAGRMGRRMSALEGGCVGVCWPSAKPEDDDRLGSVHATAQRCARALSLTPSPPPSPPPAPPGACQLADRAREGFEEGKERFKQTGEDLAADMDQTARKRDVSLGGVLGHGAAVAAALCAAREGLGWAGPRERLFVVSPFAPVSTGDVRRACSCDRRGQLWSRGGAGA